MGYYIGSQERFGIQLMVDSNGNVIDANIAGMEQYENMIRSGELTIQPEVRQNPDTVSVEEHK